MPARAPLPAELRDRPFPVRDALAGAAQSTRLRSSDLARPFWGVRSTNDDANTVLGRALAYLSRAAPGHFISHASAASIWDIPLPWRLQNDERLHVAVSTEQRAPRGHGVIGHRLQLSAGDVTTHRGVRVSSLARTWCDLSTLLGEEDLVAAGDNVLWRRRPDPERLDFPDLLYSASHYSGRRGRPTIAASLPLLTDRSDSPPESVIRVRMVREGLPVPEANLELYDERGRFLAMPDLSYPTYGLTFDYEGDHHRTDSIQWEKDISRVPRLEDANWHHTRIAKSDLRDSTEFLLRTRRLLHERGWRQSPP
jgi:hypothetical protein